MRVVMPHFVTALVESLVERSAVDRFDLRFEHGVLGSSATAAASHAAPGAGVGGPGRGVVYLTGGRRGVGHWRVSSAGLSLRAFSRLSAEFWLSDVDRRDYGLVIEGDPTPLECEFMLDSLRYSRGAGIGENGTGSFHPLANNGVRLQQPCLWGHCFQMGVCVERIISDDED
uniref:Uncharacterized protein TCIL3000_7_5090 n=1 Tax=Trypanosoma congolense (strain IL3000) TaxID=1068625 RepID=G0UQN4_TRYCI|nr:unnamed protein product [Trypanosoma congolense IL3000]